MFPILAIVIILLVLCRASWVWPRTKLVILLNKHSFADKPLSETDDS